MNQKEFKSLTAKFVDKLRETAKLQKTEVNILQQDSFNNKIYVGINYEDSKGFVEVYELINNGDAASWKFAGIKG